MNEKTQLQKADEYIRHVQSEGEVKISPSVLELGKRWVKAYNILIQCPTERKALLMYRAGETDLSEDTARRDLQIAQYVFGKYKLPSRAFLIQQQLHRADKLYEDAISAGKIDLDLVAKAIDLKNKILDKLPEEVDPPDMDVFKRRIYYTVAPDAINKEFKDLEDYKALFQRVKAITSPKMNFDHVATDAEEIRN